MLNGLAQRLTRFQESRNPTTQPTLPLVMISLNSKENYVELKHCRFFHPSPELLSMLCEIMLKRKCPDLSTVLKLKQKGLGKLSTLIGAS